MTGAPAYDPETETLDGMHHGRVRLIQPRRGYRFSVDAVLAAHFAPAAPSGLALDLGAGVGVIGLLLLDLGKAARVLGMEIQPELAALAERNAAANGYAATQQTLCADFRNIETLITPQSANLVVSNPPYFPAGRGRVNPSAQLTIARHEVAGAMTDLLRAAAYALAPDGAAVFVYPVTREKELLQKLSEAGLRLSRRRRVHGKPGEPPRLVLVEARKGAVRDVVEEAPLVLEDADGRPMPEAEAIYAGTKPERGWGARPP
ncbi:MAG: methyltransferase domain-containing protein [Myxococcales bacterium]|nr:MAG: methyltransferase domain-containing protein [Myxococcales bacterium]